MGDTSTGIYGYYWGGRLQTCVVKSRILLASVVTLGGRLSHFWPLVILQW